VEAAEVAGLGGKALSGVAQFLSHRARLSELSLARPDQIVSAVLHETGYLEFLETEAASPGPTAHEAEGRIANLAELESVAASYEDLASFSRPRRSSR